MALQKKSIAFFTFTLLAIIGLASCTNYISTVDTNLSLDLSPLSSRMSALRSQGAISTDENGIKIETYYLHCTAVNANDTTKVYVDEKKEMSFPYTDTQKSITIQLINIPYGEDVSVDMKIYWDSSYSDYSLLAQGSTSFKIASSSDVSLTLTSTEKLASTISYKYSNENLTTFDEKNVSGGSDIVFTASYSGGTSPTYTWYVNGTALTGNDYTSSTMTASLDTLISLVSASSNNVYNIRCDISENGIVRSADNTVSLTYYKQIKSVAFENASYTYLLPSAGTWYTNTTSADGASTQTEYTPVWAPKYIITYTDETTSDPTSAELAAPTAVGSTTGTATVTSNQGEKTATCNITTYGTTTPTFTSTGASKDTNGEFNLQDAIAYTATVDTTYLPVTTGSTLYYTWAYTTDGDEKGSKEPATTSDLSFTPTAAGVYSFTLTVSNIVVDSTTYSLTLATPLTFTVHSGSSSVTLSTPTNQTVTLAGTLADAAIADTTTLAYTDTASALVLTATCATAATDATYTWYVNGTAVTITDDDSSEATSTLTTTPSAFADAASSAINIDGANTVTVTVTENDIIVGSAKMTLTYAL